MSCLYCDAPSEATTPDGSVCRTHAIEYYRGLVATGKSAAIIGRILDPDREAHDAEAARIHREWRQSIRPDQRPIKVQERELILTALEASHWSQKHAADRLGLSPSVLHYKIRRFQIRHPLGLWRGRRPATVH